MKADQIHFPPRKSAKRTSIVEGRARRSYGHGKPIGTWEVMIKDHHEGYIGWAEYERNQKQLVLNDYGRAGGAKSGRGGKALLSRIMSCGRCGRRLSVAYTGNPQSRPVYRCDKPNLVMGLPRCMTFGGPRVDAATARELLQAVEPTAIEAAFEAERMHREQQEDQQQSWICKCSRPAMRQAWPSIATPPAIPTIVSLPHSWRRTGRSRSGVSGIWRHASPLKGHQT